MIYLDNNATTFLDPSVKKKVLELLEMPFANPSSIHRPGSMAKELLFNSIKSVASFFSVRENEVFFTSGATEALNMALLGFAKRGHIISSTLEHVAVLEPLYALEKKGWPITLLKPLPFSGKITLDQVKEAVRADTTLICLMAVNNETGVKTDIEAIASFAEERGIFFLVDGVGLLGKEPFTLPRGVSAICFSSHKIHGPHGLGLAIIKKKYPFTPLVLGGPQQGGKRGGTENILSIVGFAKALELLKKCPFHEKIGLLRDRFEKGILDIFPNAIIHGKDEKRICNTSNICFDGQDGETLLIQLDLNGIAASHGAACSSGGLTPSRVLLNMGVSQSQAKASIRFSLSRFTTEEEIDYTLQILSKLIVKK